MSKLTTQRLAVFLLGASAAGLVLAQAGKEVKIGVLNDQSGPYSSITGAGSVVAAKLAIEDAGGSLFGKPVQILVGDHMHKPDVGTTLARRWYDTEGVSAIFDIYSSGVALAVQKISEEKGKVLAISMGSSRDISGKNCSRNGMQFANDGYAVANLTVKGSMDATANSWYFLTADYAAGYSIEKDSRRMIEEAGGKFVGSTKFPLGSADFSSFLLQAQASKAKNIGFIGGGADMINVIKQSVEFGVSKGGQRLIPFSMTTDDVYALGSAATAGMPVVQSFVWDGSPASRAWTERFKKASGGKMPTDPQANVYSAVLHYLKAVKAEGSTDNAAVLARMKATPVEDFFTKGARIRDDGRVMRPMYYATVKPVSQMKSPDDLVSIVKQFSGEETFIPVALSECPLLKK